MKYKKQGKLIMRREINVIIEQDADGYFVASVPNRTGCHTQAIERSHLLATPHRRDCFSWSLTNIITPHLIKEFPAT